MTVSFAVVGLIMIFATGKATSIEEAIQLVSGKKIYSPQPKKAGDDEPLLQKHTQEI